MTPEERADAINCPTHAPHNHQRCIAEAIRAAIAEERAACARVAEEVWRSADDGTAIEAAAAIRARGAQ